MKSFKLDKLKSRGFREVSLYLACNDINKHTKVRFLKSSEHIRKKVDGPYFEVSAKKPHQ